MNRKCCRAEVGFWRKTSGVGGLCRGGGAPLYVFLIFFVFFLRLWKCFVSIKKKKRNPQSYYPTVACRRLLAKLSKVYYMCGFIWILRNAFRSKGRETCYIVSALTMHFFHVHTAGIVRQTDSSTSQTSIVLLGYTLVMTNKIPSKCEILKSWQSPLSTGGKKAKLSWIIIDFKLRQTIGFHLWLTELLSYACVSRCVI